MIVHQILSGAGPRDAITTEARAFRARFRGWGWGGQDVAARIAPGLWGEIASLDSFSPAPDELLLFHHSASTPRLHELLALPNRKLLLYHNVTPAAWLWDHAPLVALHCALGREQLPGLVAASDIAAADSEFNATELSALGARRTAVIPVLVEPARLGSANGAHPARAADRGPIVLFVGRLSPHKRQDRVIEAFALFRRHRAPGARLMLVGEPVTSAYVDHLVALAEGVAAGAVSIESGLSSSELGDRYRAADVFLCLSEHEGFCVPLLEAMQFGLPVIARAAGAVPEVAGDAAILVDEDDPALVAELLHLATTDREMIDELRRRGHGRLELYAPDRVAARLREVVLAASGNGLV
jgi:glycosyltransferase involved in cell wall biosynthesis